MFKLIGFFHISFYLEINVFWFLSLYFDAYSNEVLRHCRPFRNCCYHQQLLRTSTFRVPKSI